MADPNEKLEEALGHRPKTLERQPQDSQKTQPKTAKTRAKTPRKTARRQ